MGTMFYNVKSILNHRQTTWELCFIMSKAHLTIDRLYKNQGLY